MTRTEAKWRVPIIEMNAYLHCHLYEQGAKVLSRETDACLLRETLEKLTALCPK